ncbi:MAG TPA: hypothetical protein VIY09_08225 [Rhizomicrobium sp.]
MRLLAIAIEHHQPHLAPAGPLSGSQLTYADAASLACFDQRGRSRRSGAPTITSA